MTRSNPVSQPQPQTSAQKHILMIDEPSGRRAITLDSPAYSIGRDPSCSIRLNHPMVSRQHGMLIRVFDEISRTHLYQLFDGNQRGERSRNGTHVNNRLIFCHRLKDGDVIDFGTGAKVHYYVRTLTTAPESPILTPLLKPVQGPVDPTAPIYATA